MSATKRLRVFAGPNGSGKSTLFTTIMQQFRTGHFVNSDEIEKESVKLPIGHFVFHPFRRCFSLNAFKEIDSPRLY
jgi:ABC-type Mn2+/Zn2+ transport system ATPase subunit